MKNDESQKLKLIAEKVLYSAKLDKNEKFGSVIAILMIISVILTAVRILQECNKSKTGSLCKEDKFALYGKEIKLFSSRRGWFTKMRLKKILRKELSREDYIKYSIPLVEAILTTGESLKDDEVITLVEAANV